MDDKQVKIVLGGLLHDIGKLLYRYNDGRRHSVSGYEFLKENGIEDEEILNQARYHHAMEIRGSSISNDSLAYITYWADNVASAADRRNKTEESGQTFEKYVPLQSVFNILNGNNQNFSYEMAEVYDDGNIVFPKEKVSEYSEEQYGRIIKNIRECIGHCEMSEAYVNSLISILEANLSFVPSSSNTTQLVDISLFDHMKITAAIGSCIYEYLKEKGETDYRTALLNNAEMYYGCNTFLMYSMDISGIQKFIYSVDRKGALKALRSKSFYLEMMLEHIIDELLDRINVSRANLIYAGGGHAYILLPNTESTKTTIESFDKALTNWFIENFTNELYVANAFVECSANDLMNKDGSSYENIFKNLSKCLSAKKAARYSASDILKLNNSGSLEMTRECRVCGRTDYLTEDNICEFCSMFQKLSNSVLREKFIVILENADASKPSIRMPFDKYMLLEGEDELKARIERNNNYIRSYSKNKMYTGYNVSTRLWIADYAAETEFSALADASNGIRRIGVLRADVDNLGQAFISGFDPQYTSLSRAATFSRKLNMFFKLNINNILRNGSYSITGEKGERKATIVYSGGDDVFIIGAWDEVIECAVDISDALNLYTQGTLSISAGIGIYPSKYPVKAMARQTGMLEDASKSIVGKNAITLFDGTDYMNTYHWNVFKEKVIGEKYRLLEEYFSANSDKGMSALYTLLDYIRNIDDKINLARLAYMLGRMEPERGANEIIKSSYRNFSQRIYKWLSDDSEGENKRQLVTAIYLYVYLHREREAINGKIK